MPEILVFAKVTGKYSSALREVILRKATVEAAKEAGITVSARQLQNALRTFRRSRHLIARSGFESWLTSVGLAPEALAQHLEEDVLIAQFKKLLARNARQIRPLSRFAARLINPDTEYKKWLDATLS
ncbi:MAG: hypothetical protein WCG76_10765 [Verrucomicrobiota bacterium]